jgi:hypothetical protein
VRGDHRWSLLDAGPCHPHAQIRAKGHYGHIEAKYMYLSWEKWLKRSNIIYNKVPTFQVSF